MKKLKQQLLNDSGFTLIELMIVVAILGILSAIAVPNYIGYLNGAKERVVISSLQNIEKEIILFQLVNGRYPSDLAEVGLDSVTDPWGNPYRYLNIEEAKGNGKKRKNYSMVPVNNDFDLYSMGPDGKSQSPFTAKNSRDDYVRANNGAFLGKVTDY